MSVRPYPLLLEPILKEKVWGGSRLGRLGKPFPPGVKVGESWELADLGSTSPSGGGGGEARSRIVNGGLAGRTLHDAVALWGEQLLGEARPTPEGNFPLLVKFLDACENLSVQVHPSPEYAAAHPGCHVKTECWYVLDAEPGSVIYKGLRAGVTRESFARRVREGTAVEDLFAVPAVKGECHVLPSGTCHALGAGVLVAEVQTPSDTTFRVFDWGRSGRELHVEQALECIHFGEAPPTERGTGGRWSRLAKTESFNLFEFWSGDAPVRGVEDYRSPRRPSVLTVLEGAARLGDLEAPAGSTVLVPVAAEVALDAAAGTRVLVAMVKGCSAG